MVSFHSFQAGKDESIQSYNTWPAYRLRKPAPKARKAGPKPVKAWGLIKDGELIPLASDCQAIFRRLPDIKAAVPVRILTERDYQSLITPIRQKARGK
jgi:hypothetical protein